MGSLASSNHRNQRNHAEKHCVVYSRVSTEKQHTANQVNILTEWVKTRGFTLVEVYQEQESAWRNGHQRELARLTRDAQRGKFKVVLVWALDRLSREGSLAILQLVNRFSSWGVKVLSYQEPWTEAPGEIGELLYALTGWVARMESQRRSERTKAGLARVKAQGKHLGRPKGSKDKKRRRRRRVTPAGL